MSCGFYFYNINVVSLIPIHYIYLYIYIHSLHKYVHIRSSRSSMARFPQVMAIESSEYVLNRGAFQSGEASEKEPGLSMVKCFRWWVSRTCFSLVDGHLWCGFNPQILIVQPLNPLMCRYYDAVSVRNGNSAWNKLRSLSSLVGSANWWCANMHSIGRSKERCYTDDCISSRHLTQFWNLVHL